MDSQVRITDVSPRDGLQNEQGVVPTADKVRLIQMLALSGVDEVEASSFVSPRWIPQLADAEEVLTAVKTWALSRTAVPHASEEKAAAPVFSVLVPNDKGFERALALHDALFPLKIAVFAAASETFSQRNTNASIEQSIGRFREFLSRAFDAGMAVRLYVSCAVACPFEGPVAPGQVRRVADRLLALCPDDAIARGDVEVDLGDTIGVATPGDIRALLGVFDEVERRDLLVLHLHDTFGRAAACVSAALDLGVRSFDSAAGGLGGCPYASKPGKPAPGNIATETLVRTVENSGFSTRIKLDALMEAGRFAKDITERARLSATDEAN